MLDHNSVLRPLQALADQRNIALDLVHFDPISGLLDEQHFATLLADQPVRLVVLNHASNVTGRIQNVAKLTEMAHAAGAMVLLDAAQTAGHVPLNMAELNVDFLAAAGHKGLLGPLGTGILCLRKELATDLRPLRYGGTGTASESLLQPEEMPARFESGNMNLPGIAGLDAAADWLLKQGISALHEKGIRSVQILIDGLRLIDGVQLLTPHSGHSDHVDNSDLVGNSGIVSFRVQGQDCRDVAMILDQSFDIQCRAGLHCAPLAHQILGTMDEGGAVRFSPGVFTTADELSRAIEAVAAIAAQG
jgi:selenocysteine lyase/cysteine desulfurase